MHMHNNLAIILGSIVVIVVVIVLVIARGNDGLNTQNISDDSKLIQQVIPADSLSLAKSSGEYVIDENMSRVEWTGRAVGKEHVGQVNVKSGSLILVDGVLSAGNVVINMTSISDSDLDSVMQERLVAHLKSNDFFAVGDYPESKMVITDVQEGAQVDQYRMSADVTIKDVTRPIIFDAIVTEKSGIVSFTTKFDIDRTQWNIDFGSQSLVDRVGNVLIDDMISFNVLLVGVDQSLL